MVNVDSWRGRGYLVGSPGAARQGLAIHGYGGNSGEMLGLAVDLAARLNLRLLVFDLPGHGGFAREPLTRAAALSALESALGGLEAPAFFIGHSLGARLGLEAGLETAVLISMPGSASFAGSRHELMRTLRARRVNEPRPLQGLEEILAGQARPAPRTLLLRARHELDSVISLTAAWEKRGLCCRKIKDSSHNDIISSAAARETIAAWLEENLP